MIRLVFRAMSFWLLAAIICAEASSSRESLHEETVALCKQLLEAVSGQPRYFPYYLNRYSLRQLSENVFMINDSGLAQSHELEAGIRLGKYLAERGERLVLMPFFKHRAVPGFDGVIFNFEGRAVANVSLKSALYHAADIKAIATQALIDAEYRGAEMGGWLEMLGLLGAEAEVKLWNIVRVRPNRRETFMKSVDWQKELLSLLNPPIAWLPESGELRRWWFDRAHRGRPARVFVDIRGPISMLSDKDLQKIRRSLRGRERFIEGVLFLSDKTFIDVSPAQIIKKNLR